MLRIGRKLGVTMQKQQDIAGRKRSAGVLLRSTTARCGNHDIRAHGSKIKRSVIASAVNHNHFGTPLTKRCEAIKCRCDALAFIEHGNDDRELQIGQARHTGRVPFIATSGQRAAA